MKGMVVSISPKCTLPPACPLMLNYYFGQGGGSYHAPTVSMKLLGQNCRGICNASIVRAFKAQIKGVRPNLIFFSETKALVSRMDFVRSSISFDNMLVVEESGKAGGLCVLWKEGISVKEV